MKLISIRNLISDEALEDFDCGVEPLNEYLHRYALKNDLDNIGKTYLCLEENKILGFFTLANWSIRKEILSSLQIRLPKYPIPIVLLARLAVDIRYQGIHIGRFMVKTAIELAYKSSLSIAAFGLLVDAKPESTGFYELMGFVKLDSELHYFYPMKKIECYFQNGKDEKKK